MNIFLHPDQKEKLLIHILRKLQKLVIVFTIFFFFATQFSAFVSNNCWWDLAAPVLSQVSGSFQSSSALLEPGYILKHDSSAMPKTPIINTAVSSWSNNSLQKTTSVLHGTKGWNFCASNLDYLIVEIVVDVICIIFWRY